MSHFEFGDRVVCRREVAGLIKKGEKGTITRLPPATGDAVLVHVDSGRSFWMKPAELELDDSPRSD